MANEFDFMKSAQEKEMPDEEYKTLREGYDKTAEDLNGKLKKTMIALLVIFAISFAALYIICILNSEANFGEGLGNYTWLLVEFLIVIFFYDPKGEENKKHKYETDKKILLNSVRARIKMIKIKIGLVIGLGTVFLFLNGIAWWSASVYLTNPENPGYSLFNIMLKAFGAA